MKYSNQNIFVAFLDLLKVKYTKGEANKLYEEHPHRDNLYGLSSMLFMYGVENESLRLGKDVGILCEIESPFIAHVGNDFALVHKVTSNSISYYWRKKAVTTSVEDFLKVWSGVILIAETNEKSIEPNYRENLYKELLQISKKIALCLGVITIMALIGIQIGNPLSIGRLSAMFINVVGVYISSLLLLKQMHIHSNSADKICSLFLKQGDCNHILETKAAKFLGIFSWSEIGLSYFIANLIIVLYLPLLYPYSAIINMLALPYTIWSIWYQAKIAKQWCMLCIVIQILLWLLFVSNLKFALIDMPVITAFNLFLTGCLYAIPLLSLNLTIPYFVNFHKLQSVSQQLNNLKASEGIFSTLLKQQPYYKVDQSIGLLWGNLKAKHTITVITNPHCNPCAEMHGRLKKLLNDTKDGFCIRYILASFNEELAQSNRLFITIHQQKQEKEFLSFLDEWYTGGRHNYKEMYIKYAFNKQDERLEKEYSLQKNWLNGTSIHDTPTLLFDGYELTNKYVLEDLVYVF